MRTDIVKAWAKTKQNPTIELQFKSGISYGTAFKVLKGVCPERPVTQKKIADAIGVDVDDLFPESEDLAS